MKLTADIWTKSQKKKETEKKKKPGPVFGPDLDFDPSPGHTTANSHTTMTVFFFCKIDGCINYFCCFFVCFYLFL